MVDRVNIQLSHNEAEEFLRDMLHSDPDAAEARNAFLRDARNNTRYTEENGETRIQSAHINEEGLRRALMRRGSRREAVTSSIDAINGMIAVCFATAAARGYIDAYSNMEQTIKQTVGVSNRTINSVYIATEEPTQCMAA